MIVISDQSAVSGAPVALYSFWIREEMDPQRALISGRSPETRRIQGFKSSRMDMALSTKKTLSMALARESQNGLPACSYCVVLDIMLAIAF